MEDQYKTKEQLINELTELRHRMTELGKSEAERKRVEETLKESEAKFNNLFEGSHDPILLADPETGRFVACNRKAEELSGYSRDEILSMKIGQFTPEDLKGDTPEELQKLVAGKGMRKEWEILTKDGNRMPVEISSTLISVGDKRYLQGVVRDITERKRAEEMLQKSERTLRGFMSAIKESAFVVDTEGIVIIANETLAQRLGINVNELIGTCIYNCLPPEIARDRKTQVDEVIRTGKPIRYEDRRAGMWIDSFVYPIFDEDGKVVNVGVIAVDITERKRSEEALRESKERYRIITDCVEDIVWQLDLRLHFVYVSPAVERVLGYTPQEACGLYVVDLLDEDGLVRMREVIQNRPERKTDFNIPNEYRMRHKDGYWVDVEVLSSPLFDAEGHPTGFVGITRDIGMRKRAEEEYRTIVCTTMDGFWIVDMQGRFLDLNDAYCCMVGYSRDELLTMRIPDVEAVERPKETARRIQKIMEVGGDRFETRHRCKDGKIIDMEVSVNYMEVGSGRMFVFLRDITERKRAEEALRESEGKYRNLVESVSDVIYTLDSSGVITYISPVVKNTLGYEPDELIGRQFLEFVHKEDHDLLMRRFSELREGIVRQSDYRVIGKHGDIKWVRTLTNPIIEEGGFVGARGVLIDITERKQAEDALRVSLEKYRVLFESFPLGITISDKSGKIMEGNRQSEKLLGITRKVHAQRRIDSKEWQIIRKDGTPMPADEYASSRALRENRLIENVEMGIVKDKGEITWISVTAAPIPLEGYGVAIAYGDITERKRIEEALKKSEALHKEAQKAAHIGHWELDTSIMVPTWSEEIFRIFGLNPQKDPPSFATHQKVTHPDDWHILNNAVTTSINEGIPFDIEFRILRPDKTIRWMNAIGYPKRDSEGRIGSVFGTAQDITESKQAEDQIRSSQEQLRSLSARLQATREEERTQIAREIHDELGQALTALKMDLSWMSKKLPRDQKPLHEKAKSMSQLLDATVKTVKRISTQLRPGLLDDLGLAAAIEWQAEEFQNRTGIKCHVTAIPEEITLDEKLSTALFRIFQETLTNVTRHSHATRVKVNLRQKATKIELRVEDNGKGITEKQISSPKSFGFIGMRERVYPWGGEVKIIGTSGKGTTVIVNIPLKSN